MNNPSNCVSLVIGIARRLPPKLPRCSFYVDYTVVAASAERLRVSTRAHTELFAALFALLKCRKGSAPATVGGHDAPLGERLLARKIRMAYEEDAKERKSDPSKRNQWVTALLRDVRDVIEIRGAEPVIGFVRREDETRFRVEFKSGGKVLSEEDIAGLARECMDRLAAHDERLRKSDPTTPAPTPSLFTYLDAKLRRSAYFQVCPPITVLEGRTSQLSCWIRPERFRFGLPRRVDAVIAQAAETLAAQRGAPRRRVFAECRGRLREGNFAQTDEFPGIQDGSSSLEVVSHLLERTTEVETAKREVLYHFLTGAQGFYFNKPGLGVSQFRVTATAAELRRLELILQPTDYYTFSTLMALGGTIHGACGFSEFLKLGLSEYLAGGNQRFIHAGFGLGITIRTLTDNLLIVTRRSGRAANPFGEAGKYFMSVNEAMNDSDIDPVQTDRLRPLIEVVRRALKEEMFGSKEGEELVDTTIRRCVVTGAKMYLPNLCINLCVHIDMDCSAEDVRAVHPHARDWLIETSGIIREPSAWAKGLPEYSPDGLERFLRETVREHEETTTNWDEGALVVVLLSRVAMDCT